ncbi:MAG: hypothetical protein ACOC36_05805 [Fibrobacterota bacterium]
MNRSKLITRLLQIAQIALALILTGMMIKAMRLLYVFLRGEGAL